MTSQIQKAPPRFVDLVADVTSRIAGKPVEPALGEFLALAFPPDGAWFTEMTALCRQGRADGWLCAREHGGIRFGRPVKPGPETHGFSVDVVEMREIVGPHHRHPHGEIDMVMPDEEGAVFDGSPRGWKVYGPDSAHRPSVSGGCALVLYLLPAGAIDFTDPQS